MWAWFYPPGGRVHPFVTRRCGVYCLGVMGQLVVEGPDLVLRLSWLEKLEGMRGDLRLPVSSVRSVRAVAEAWPELRGIRAPGTGWPGVIAVGTRRWGGGKDFAVVHGKGPALVVELEAAEYDRVVVTSDGAPAEVARLVQQLGLA